MLNTIRNNLKPKKKKVVSPQLARRHNLARRRHNLTLAKLWLRPHHLSDAQRDVLSCGHMNISTYNKFLLVFDVFLYLLLCFLFIMFLLISLKSFLKHDNK